MSCLYSGSAQRYKVLNQAPLLDHCAPIFCLLKSKWPTELMHFSLKVNYVVLGKIFGGHCHLSNSVLDTLFSSESLFIPLWGKKKYFWTCIITSLILWIVYCEYHKSVFESVLRHFAPFNGQTCWDTAAANTLCTIVMQTSTQLIGNKGVNLFLGMNHSPPPQSVW